MRIREYLISRYGPLKESGRIRPGDFTLFYGPNENGKTLTIDAILKLLFGKEVKKFDKIHRVDEDPHGFIIIQDENKQTFQLPEKGDLTGLTGINPNEARNIFVIRDSDLSLHEESEHYRTVTDKLTGMRTEQIENVTKELLNIGRVTPSGLFTNREDKVRERMNQAETLLDVIRQKKKNLRIEKADTREKERAEISDSIRKLNHKSELCRLAKKRKNFEKGSAAVQALKKSRRGLDSLQGFNDREEQTWVEYERDIQQGGREENRMKQKLKQETLEFKTLEETARKLRQEFEIIDQTRSRIDQELKTDMKNYEIKAGELKEKEGKSRFYMISAAVSFLLTVLFTIALILNPGEIFLVPFPAVFLLLTAVFGMQRYIVVRDRSWLAGLLERIKLNLAKFKIRGDNIEDLYAAVQEFDHHWKMKKKQFEDAENRLRLQQNTIRTLRDEELPRIQSSIEEAEAGIRKIKDRTGVKTLSEYREKIKEREDRQNTIKNQINLLSALFGRDFDDLEANIEEWEKDVRRLEPYRDQALSLEYRPEEYEQLQNQQRELEEKKELVENDIRDFQKQLREVEQDANRILEPESEHLPCKTSVDLMEIENQVRNFISTYKKRAEIILKAQGIFQHIMREEEEKVTRLFGKDSAVSRRFARITGNRYREVHFDPETKQVMVTTRPGETLEAGKLSGGTYDQLYLSIRLGLGESLMSDRTGFFILDDPFIKADIERLREQMVVLKQIASSGWQVLYFSAKDEVKQMLIRDIQDGAVELVSLPGLI
ncbi:MAG: AAA family ATPase [Candidatus Aminicenantes bacterium]